MPTVSSALAKVVASPNVSPDHGSKPSHEEVASPNPVSPMSLRSGVLPQSYEPAASGVISRRLPVSEVPPPKPLMNSSSGVVAAPLSPKPDRSVPQNSPDSPVPVSAVGSAKL